MPALTPIPREINLEINRRNRAQKKKRANPVKTAKAPEVKYRRELDVLVKRLKQDVATSIVPALKLFESEYVNDAYARTFQELFDNLKRFYNNIDPQAQTVANNFVTNSNQVNKARFYNSIERAIGINLSSVVQNEGLEDTLLATTQENVNLIKSIPQQYLKNIESIVYSGTVQGNSASSMIQQISKQGGVTSRRAKLIARDQSSKLNSALNQQRQQNLGVEEYIWRTAGDERVRDSHRSKNGKIFRWDDPPKDTGHPGFEIQCRCQAEPIINL